MKINLSWFNRLRQAFRYLTIKLYHLNNVFEIGAVLTTVLYKLSALLFLTIFIALLCISNIKISPIVFFLQFML